MFRGRPVSASADRKVIVPGLGPVEGVRVARRLGGIVAGLKTGHRSVQPIPPRVLAVFSLTDAERRTILGMSSNGDRFIDLGAIKRLELLFEQDQAGPMALTMIRVEWPDHGLQPLAYSKFAQ